MPWALFPKIGCRLDLDGLAPRIGEQTVARKPRKPVSPEDARRIGAILRDLRRAAGYRAVRDVARVKNSPAAAQTIYAYERGGLLPSLRQVLELVEFYASTEGDSRVVRYQAVAAVEATLDSPAYGFVEANELIRRLQPDPQPGRRRAAKRPRPSAPKIKSRKP